MPENSSPDAGPSQPAGEERPKRSAKDYLEEIRQAEKDATAYTTRARKLSRLYAYERDELSKSQRQYAMLWANVEVLKPSVYARQPEPAVNRRFSDRDPIGRHAGEVMQRSLSTTFDLSDIDACLRDVRDDFLIVARGTAWARYEPKFETQELQAEGDDEAESYESVTDETVCFDFVHWADFVHPKARRWGELPWVARKVHMDREALTKRFGKEKADKLYAKASENPRDDAGRFAPKAAVKACVYELWSKRDNEVVWLGKDLDDEELDRRPPLYNLHGFFPCPKPAYGTLSTDSLTPVPDYVYYQDQAEEIDGLTAKIGALEDALKLVGFYPAGAEGEISSAIERALTPGTSNMMVPVPGWAAFTAGGGAGKMIEWLPIDAVLKALQGAVELRKQLIEDVYQITGISDILRGETEASETATAQRIKSQWGGIRIRDRQAEMARFARDLTRIAAEIIAEKFQPETLWRMTGLQFPTEEQKQQAQAVVQQIQALTQQPAAGPSAGAPGGHPQPQPGAPPAIPPAIEQMLRLPAQEEIVQLLRDDRMRSYRVDIETDSTIEADEQAAKASVNELLTSVGGFMVQALPIGQQVPEFVPVIGEMLQMTVRTHRAGRRIEDAIEQAVEQLEEKARMAVENPPPDAALEEAKGKLALEEKRLELDTQERAARFQSDVKERADRMQFDRERFAAEMQNKALDRQDAVAAREAQRRDALVARQEDRQAADVVRAEDRADRLSARREDMDVARSTREQDRADKGLPAQHEMVGLVAEMRQSHASISDALNRIATRLVGNEQTIAALGQGQDRMQAIVDQLGAAISGLVDQMRAPAELIRDAGGRTVGVRKGGIEQQVVRGADGQVTGLQ